MHAAAPERAQPLRFWTMNTRQHRRIAPPRHQDPHMNFNMTTFLIGAVAGILGAAYFIYGKKEQRPVPLLSGALLCVLPYFIDNVLVLVLVCLGLLVAPFVIKIEL